MIDIIIQYIYYYLSLIQGIIPDNSSIENSIIPFFTPSVTLIGVLFDIVIIILCVILVLSPPRTNGAPNPQEPVLESIEEIMRRVLAGEPLTPDTPISPTFFNALDDLFPESAPPETPPPLYNIIDPFPEDIILPSYAEILGNVPSLTNTQIQRLKDILNEIRTRRTGGTGGSLSGGGNVTIKKMLEDAIQEFGKNIKDETKIKIETAVTKNLAEINAESNTENKILYFCILFVKFVKFIIKDEQNKQNIQELQQIKLNVGGGRKKKKTLRKKKKNKKKKSRRSKRLQRKSVKVNKS
jgi:hypothetical protein